MSRTFRFFCIVMLGLTPLLASPRAAHAQGQRPNVLIILADDLGWGDLTSYGAKDLRTPNIDALVNAGMRFDNFYANCCVCSPTRAALLTGRYQELVGVPGVIRTNPADNWGYLTKDAVLIPTPLHQAGYHSAIVGKWHLGLESPNIPNDRGFDFFHGFLGDMMEDYWTHIRDGHNYLRLNRQMVDPKGHATDVFTQWAIEYIKDRAAAPADKRQPWFLYLAYNAPHFPVQPPPDWLQKVKEREKGIDPIRAKLVALIEHLDHGVGQVIDALRQTHQYDNTLIIFTSDNGGHGPSKANVGPYRGFKQDMYDGGLRVPMCAVWKGKIMPGSKSGLVALTFDLFPTVCEAAGAKIDHPIEGVSILPTLLGKKQEIDRDLFFCRREGNNRYQGQDYYAMRRGDWKLLHNTPFLPYELYNLKDDPYEKTNVAGKERKVFNALSAALRRQIQRAGAVTWQAPARVSGDE
jgi:arylsulfatase A-like enzyme